MTKDTALAAYLNDLIGDEKEFRSNIQLAERVGVSEGTIRNLRKGSNPSLSTLHKLSDGLHVPLTELEKKLGIREYESAKSKVRTMISDIVSRLHQDDQELVREFALTLLKRQERQTK